ncbi:MAG: branched-chain amino acid ABC transporter permease [Oscillospiraceae bacterium]|nr:branched-chain amino acid ABC transporter permease [Oscillospiraceae bacterium]
MTHKHVLSSAYKLIGIKSGVIVAAIIALALLPLYGSAHAINVGILVFSYLALGQMWNLLAGYSGLVSLGHQAFIGIGAYTLAVVTVSYGGGFFMSFLISIVIAVLFSLVISFPIFKLSGVYFTIGTWIVSESVLMFFRNWRFVNFDAGMNITRAFRIPQENLYLGALALGIVSVALVYFILRSKMGLSLMAMRDNPAAAEVRGVHLYKTKLICFLIASTFITITGVLLYMNIAFVMPGPAFGIDWAVSMVFIVVIGGIGTIEGPIIGAAIYVFLRQFLFNFPGMSLIILGSIAVIVILVAPKGIMGAIHGKFGFELFSVRRKMED